EHLAVGLRSDEREEELPGRAGDLAGALLSRHALFALPRVLLLEAREHGANAVVEHARTLRQVDLDEPLVHAHGERLDRQHCRQRQRPARADVDVRAVARADGVALFRVTLPLAERAVVVGAAITDGAVLPAKVV